MKKSVKIGIVQEKPVHLNLDQTLKKVADLVAMAANDGADLVVFGETWLTGYPAWLDHCPNLANWNYEPMKAVYAQLHEHGVEVPGKATELLSELARKHEVVICIGANEVVRSGVGNGTIYNSLLVFNEKGELVNHHRKLVPTYTEKLLHGPGDGEGLKAVDTAAGRIGGLICWEHWMPLTRQTMHNSGEQIHIALWPMVHEMHQIASRHYAFEGRCFVVAVGQLMQVNDFPKELELPEDLKDKPDQFILNGGSCVIGPDGQYILEPQFERPGVIMVEIEDLNQVYKERMTLDTSGHYNRNDVFNFEVNHNRKK
jgi:nitrilase